MKALSVRQPWAQLIIHGAGQPPSRKDVENRTWRCRYRGPVLVCAGALPDRSAAESLRARGLPMPEGRLPVGVALGVVQLVDIVDDSPSPWASPGCRHWIIEDPRPLAIRFEVVGQLGLFDVDIPGPRG